MLSKFHRSSLKPFSLSSGFTLLEVLIGVSLTLLVISVAGFGLANLLRNTYKTGADSEIRNNLNRATEFISDEVRRATKIISDQDGISKDAKLPIPLGAQKVLALELPNYRDQIIYYVDKPTAPGMIGPLVLHRFGPSFDDKGNYQTQTDATGQVINDNWKSSVVVDMLVDSSDVTDKDCDGWNRIPAKDNEVKGFYVCVNEVGNMARPYLQAQVPLTSSTGGKTDRVEYSADTKSFARAATSVADSIDVPTTPSTTPPSPSPSPSPSPTPTPPEVCKYDIDPDGPTLIMEEGCRIKVEEPTNICQKACSLSVPSSQAQDTMSIPAYNLPVFPGDNLEIIAGSVMTPYGNNPRQSVEILTPETALPRGISLNSNQVIYILTDIGNKKVYNILVTFG